ncbi:MAG: hypothetical protein HYZ42_01520, partial [Bacteroidetes bacterium]|nr:hypothetical protein [Bacteroidota bacterium]
IMINDIAFPTVALALTGGPSQPEVESFEPVTTNQMVDLFTGDFNYNIPLLDVGGYPVNIAYHAGIGMDQEASWVGLGWNINPGVINRTMRGLPDDFNGDHITRTNSSKPSNTVALNYKKSIETFSLSDDEMNISASMNMGIKYNSYRGIGYKMGFGMSGNLWSKEYGGNTSVSNDDSKASLRLGYNVSISSDEGLEYSPELSLSLSKRTYHKKRGEFENTNSLSLGANISSRRGLAGLSIGYSSVSNRLKEENDDCEKIASSMSNTSVSIGMNISKLPISTTSYVSSSQPETNFFALGLSYSQGPSYPMDIYKSYSISGSYAHQSLYEASRELNAYGFLYQHNYTNPNKHNQDDWHGRYKGGNSDNQALLDFNREKDLPFIYKNSTNLPLTMATYDIFSVNGQGTGGMFRPFRNDLNLYFDPRSWDLSHNVNAGIELGRSPIPANKKLGINASFAWFSGLKGSWNDGAQSVEELWTSSQSYSRASYDHQGYEPAYFKMAGEKTINDNYRIQNEWKGETPVMLSFEDYQYLKGFETKAIPQISTNYNDNTHSFENEVSLTSNYNTINREVRTSNISFLTNKQAAQVGFQKDLLTYSQTNNKFPFTVATLSRTSGTYTYKDDHIGEVYQTNPDGTRYIYGIPAYNNYQKEITFNIAGVEKSPDDYIAGNCIKYSTGDNTSSNQRGIDHALNIEELPPFVHSHLLTGVINPDYVDRTGDGITDDDYGTFYRFNYTRVQSDYKWRIPYLEKSATYNKAIEADVTDDKASYT